MSEVEQARGKWARYPDCRDSGVEWLGDVPADWRVVSLKRLFRIVNGATPSTSEPAYWDGDTVWVTPDDLGQNTEVGIASSGRCITAEGLRSCAASVVPAGSLVVSTRAPIGYVGLAEVDLCTNQGCRSLVPLQETTSRYFLYLLQTMRPYLQVSGTGSTFMELSGAQLGALPVTLPRLAEQRAIAEFLDRETGRIDALIETKRRLIELLEEKRTALITRAVTKGLDPDAPLKPSGVEWLGDIPEHWEAQRLRFAARLESGHTPSRSVDEYWVNCAIPWVSLADVGQLRDDRFHVINETHECISELGMRNSAARLLPERTVILSRTASVGFSAILGKPMATTQDFVNWICGPDLVPEFLLLCFHAMKHEFRRLTMGSTHQTIYMPDVKRFSVPLPPVKEQEEIVRDVFSREQSIEDLISLIRDAITTLQEYRTALTSAAVTGKIDVRDM